MFKHAVIATVSNEFVFKALELVSVALMPIAIDETVKMVRRY